MWPIRRWLLYFGRRLLAVRTRFEEWVVLGKVDIEKLVATHCETYDDYERNFRMVKLKGKLVEDNVFVTPFELQFVGPLVEKTFFLGSV